ncbi:MAG TPA: hypothetical protein VGX25_19170 [Actinophytocola sp.]|uniref:hypothetical protein n=1 Tax=Actinophytocola sp. TaxID=1872138 RepID=UPI002DDD57FD|nr:hypothetical protein [Actinophytocola sp.]HEV2781509.1 hypothetical protein [Actinophytocola sp.]
MLRRRSPLAVVLATAMSIGSLGATAGTDPPNSIAGNPVYDHVRHYLDWTVPFSRGLTASMVSIQPATGPDGAQTSGIASYAEGFLAEPSNSPNKVNGTLSQYFNDRRYSTSSYPFDPARRDSLGLHITADPTTQSVTVTLVALSWGGGSQSLTNLRIEDGVLVGDGASAGGQTPSALYAVSLGTMTIPG